MTLVDASISQHANDVSFSEFLSRYESSGEYISDAVVPTTTQTVPQQSFSEFVASYNEGNDAQYGTEAVGVATMHNSDNQDFFQFVSQYGTSSITEDNDEIQALSVKYVDTVSPVQSSRRTQSQHYAPVHNEIIDEKPEHLLLTQRKNNNIVLHLSAILAIILLIIYSLMKIMKFVLRKKLTQSEAVSIYQTDDVQTNTLP